MEMEEKPSENVIHLEEVMENTSGCNKVGSMEDVETACDDTVNGEDHAQPEDYTRATCKCGCDEGRDDNNGSPNCSDSNSIEMEEKPSENVIHLEEVMENTSGLEDMETACDDTVNGEDHAQPEDYTRASCKCGCDDSEIDHPVTKLELSTLERRVKVNDRFKTTALFSRGTSIHAKNDNNGTVLTVLGTGSNTDSVKLVKKTVALRPENSDQYLCNVNGVLELQYAQYQTDPRCHFVQTKTISDWTNTYTFLSAVSNTTYLAVDKENTFGLFDTKKSPSSNTMFEIRRCDKRPYGCYMKPCGNKDLVVLFLGREGFVVEEDKAQVDPQHSYCYYYGGEGLIENDVAADYKA